MKTTAIEEGSAIRPLKPHHVFNHMGQWCLINTEDMCASPIGQEAAEFLQQRLDNPAPDGVAAELHRLDLYADPNRCVDHQHWLKKEPLPVATISLFLTQTCNFDCVYCYGAGGQYGEKGSMDEKTAFRAVDWLIAQSGDFKRINIGFFGGEPLLKFRLMKKTVAYARRKAELAGKQASFIVNTNGSLLSERRITYLKDNDITVKVSLDGPASVHNAQRPLKNGRGTYDLLRPKLEKLLAALPESDGHATLLPGVDPATVRKSLLDVGFKQISILPASPSVLAGAEISGDSGRDESALYKDMEAESDAIIDGIKNRNIEFVKRTLPAGQFFHPLRFLLYHLKTYYPCGAGLGYVAVSVNGDVYLCQRFVGMKKYKIGSIHESSLDRSHTLESPVVSNKTCSRCFARYYCAGGCAYDNVSCNGSAYSPSQDMCRWWRRKLELAAYIVSMLDPSDIEFMSDNQIVFPKPCPLDF